MERDITITENEIKSYWRDFISRARKYAWETAETRITVLILLALMIMAGVSGIGVALGLVPLNIFDEQVNNLRAGFWAVIASLVVFALAFAGLTYKIPVEVHKEQLSKINDLVNANNLKLTEVNKENFTGIRTENFDIRTFRGQLTLTSFDGKPLDTVFELGMFVGYSRESKLEWPPNGSARLIELAIIDPQSKNAFIIEASRSNAWKQKDSGEYELETQISGILGEHEINAKRIKWLLKLDRENLKIGLTKIASNSD